MDSKTLKMLVSKEFDKLKKSDAGLQDAIDIVLTIIIMLITGVIGLYIGDKVLSTAGTFSDANLTSAKNSLTSTTSTGFSFLVILVVAAIGGVALQYVMIYMGGIFTRKSGGAGGGAL